MRIRLQILLLLFLNLMLSMGCTKEENIPDPVQTGPFEALDAAIVTKMEQYNMPGASIAILKNEKLVYLKSFGYADIEQNESATNNSLWRIASISKPITVVAILKLVHDGKITVDQKVFGPGSILGNDFGEVPAGSNKDLITVLNLIDHKSGWTNSPDDSAFLDNNSLSRTQIITEILQNRPLTYIPGTTRSYYNWGYSMLGRVIEKVSGKTYEDYVKTEILGPMGISEMKIGGSTLAERFPNEVIYYQDHQDHQDFSPYVMNVPRMDSSGGWIASARDLAKFMVKIDRSTAVPDFLPEDILIQNEYFAGPGWSHNGSLPGTSSILNKLNSTYSYVFLTNTRATNLVDDMYNTLKTQIEAITSWPDVDLFN